MVKVSIRIKIRIRITKNEWMKNQIKNDKWMRINKKRMRMNKKENEKINARIIIII